jgi:NAD(P)-dependent dehydrogenase (short-subunit alcohol dehydrogenase family)
MCTPRDVANAVAYLASDDADFITGVHLSVRENKIFKVDRFDADMFSTN